MITTEQTTIMVPKDMLSEARKAWPECKDLSVARILKFALAYALTDGDKERAITATRDARIGTKRTPTSE